ncbi:MAG: isoprenyl transferase [Paludibacteraceae bacterium]|nr:isoprenyl transferase [Paludibacteraceae bacterium]
MQALDQIIKDRIPAHVAIIMDGNGRWAKQHGLQRMFGHKQGVKTVHEITTAAAKLGIQYLTLYAFSTENWNRPKEEVDALMALLVETIKQETPTLMNNNVRLMTIGDLSRLPEVTRQKFEQCLEQTSHNTGLNLVLALSYSSRWEITHAMQQAATDVAQGKRDAASIDEQAVSDYMTTAGMPDPDLLIRTSGEYRISNFLLWQLAYAELYFTDKLWPDFCVEDFYAAIVDYQHRERRFGKTSEQLEVES